MYNIFEQKCLLSTPRGVVFLLFNNVETQGLNYKEIEEMIELKSQEQLKNAIERARSEARNLVVRRTRYNRQYSVLSRTSGNVYVVDFFVRKDGKRFGHCTCRAGMNNVACRHLASALGLHLYTAAHGLLSRPAMRAA
jgi:hypothetical protein